LCWKIHPPAPKPSARLSASLTDFRQATVAEANALYKAAQYSGRASPGDTLYASFSAGRCCCVTRLQDHSDVWLLRNLCTLPDHRHQGVASELCRYIMRNVEKPVWLFPLPELMTFYENSGFTVAKEDTLPDSLEKTWRLSKRKYPQSAPMVAVPDRR
ncbi:MAG: GNAT family N-acetyltransferase, partial [Thalassolituus sp.]|nr:GNAT family N-acetyltransferase [Thalassolituus sp.]